MWSPESEINSIAMATTMRHSQSSSSGECAESFHLKRTPTKTTLKLQHFHFHIHFHSHSHSHSHSQSQSHSHSHTNCQGNAEQRVVREMCFSSFLCKFSPLTLTPIDLGRTTENYKLRLYNCSLLLSAAHKGFHI